MHECTDALSHTCTDTVTRALAHMTHARIRRFAMTPYKLQSRTLPRLVMALTRKPTGNPIQINSWYVMTSRVLALDGLRFLTDDPVVRQKIERLTHNTARSMLHAFEVGSAGGSWDANLAAETFHAVQASLNPCAAAKRSRPPSGGASGSSPSPPCYADLS